MMSDILQEARRWIGTPYQHQASCFGAGADCLGLLRGVWRSLYEDEPEAVPSYTPDWSETDGVERLLDAAARHLITVPIRERRSGDVLVFRMKSGGVAKHLAFLAIGPEGQESIVHAYSGHGVVESPLSPAWARRIAAIFRFPDRRN